MSNYIEYKDKLAFHPGYYIKEIIDESGLTQDDFAKRLDTTPKNLSLLIRGEQSLSTDIALKLSRMLGTSISYWQNLQDMYDAVVVQRELEADYEEEKRVFSLLDYKYFRHYCGLPDLPRKIDEQIKVTREYLGVSSLTVLSKKDMAVSFRSAEAGLNEANIVKANAMVQIAIKKAQERETIKFDKRKFEAAVDYALTQTENHSGFYPVVKQAFQEAGVSFVIMPNMSGSKTNGATKKLGGNVMLMVSDRNLNSDTFWFTLCHEIGHIMNGDFGISFEKETGEAEENADRFASNCLIPPKEYKVFTQKKDFSADAIRIFAKSIDRDPGIVLGRLQNDGLVAYDDWSVKNLRRKYRVVAKV